MCRLLAAVTAEPRTLAEFAGSDFASFIDLSKIHKDGWGMASVDSTGAQREKFAEIAAMSPRFQNAITTKATTGALLHFRWATPGLAVSTENAHPFILGDFAFIHNGSIADFERLIPLIDPQITAERTSTGDTELYFFLLVSEIKRLGTVLGIKSALAKLSDATSYSSLNAMLLSPAELFVISENNPQHRPDWADDHYYELRYRRDQSGLLVSSSGWDQQGWELIPNHHLLKIDRATLATELIAL